MYNPGVEKVGAVGPSWRKQAEAFARKQATLANMAGLVSALLGLICVVGFPDSQYWNIRIPLYAVVVLWTIVRPRAALYLLPFAVPWGSLDAIHVGGASLTSADILVGLFTVGWLLGFTLRPYVAGLRQEQVGTLDRQKFQVPGYLLFSMLFLLFTMILSTVMATDLAASAKEIIKWGEVLVIVLLGTQYIHTRRQIWTLLIMICIAAVSQAFLGYAQAFLNLGPASFVRDSSLRVYGSFDQPNPFAGYINIALTISLALCVLGKGVKTRVFSGIACALLLGAEYYTQSKGGWLALAVAVLFILFAGMPRLRIVYASAGIALLCAIEAWLAGFIPEKLYMPLLQKAGVIGISFTRPTTSNYANSERVAHWVAGINMFTDHFWVGVGIGNYEFAYPDYIQGIFKLPLGHAHNYYINMAAETGLIGLLAFLLFISATFAVGGRAMRITDKKVQYVRGLLARPKRTSLTPHPTRMQTRSLFRQMGILVNDRALAIGVQAALLAVAVHNLVDNLYVHSITSLVALLLVLLICLKKVR